MAGAKEAEKLFKEDMAMPKTGKDWPNLPNRSSIGNTNPKNSPESPAVQSGKLVDKMNSKRGPLAKTVGTAYLEADSPQAWYMEFGWTVNGKIHYRPFMRTLSARYEDEIMGKMRESVGSKLK